MKLIKVKSFTLAETLNIAGKNFKASSANGSIEVTPEMEVSYNVDQQWLEIYYKGNLRIVNREYVSGWEPLDYTEFGYAAKTVAKDPLRLGNQPIPTGVIKAQVETPHDKVQNPPQYRTVKQ